MRKPKRANSKALTMLKRMMNALCCLFLFSQIQAQTVVWTAPPTYEKLEAYGPKYYKIRENGKSGLMDYTGQVILPAQYDSISVAHEQLSLALMKVGDKFQVKRIINYQNNTAVDVKEDYYVEQYLFFSEGKLAVSNSSRKYGYLLPEGHIVIDCQYEKAYPFYQGLACVHKRKGEVTYIHDDGAELVTDLEKEGYVIVYGSSFNEDGEAFVQAKATMLGVKRCIVDTNGHLIREAKLFSSGKPKNYRYRSVPLGNALPVGTELEADNVEPFLENGQYGYVKNNEVVIQPQFEYCSGFRGGYAKASFRKKEGILQLHSGRFAALADNNVVRVMNGKANEVLFRIQIPEVYKGRDVMVRIWDENDSVVLEEQLYDVERSTVAFQPMVQNRPDEAKYSIVFACDDILLGGTTEHVKFEYVVSLPPVLTIPQVANGFEQDSDGCVRANAQNKVEVVSRLENRSTEQLSLVLSMTGEGMKGVRKQIVLQPGEAVPIHSDIEAITERKQVTVVVETSTGLKQTAVIKVKPYI